MAYAVAEPDERYRLASCTPAKERVVEGWWPAYRRADLVIGQYLDQLDTLAGDWTRRSSPARRRSPERQRLFDAFRRVRSRCSS
jgi:DNA excision repair protein ERCC-3